MLTKTEEEQNLTTNADAVSVLVCPVVLTELCRGSETTVGAFLVSDMVGSPAASSTADHLWIVFLSLCWSSFSHGSLLLHYFGGGETRITLSPRTMTVSA